MLDLKVFTHKDVYVKNITTIEELKELIEKARKEFNNIEKKSIKLDKEYKKLITEYNNKKDEYNKFKIIPNSNSMVKDGLSTIKNFDKLIKTKNKEIQTKSQTIKLKVVDKVFEFKSDLKNYDMNAEYNVFNDIKDYLKEYPIKYNNNNLDEAFKLIQAIRRNELLEKEITTFRKNDNVQRFKRNMNFGLEEQEYYHFYSLNESSNLYPYCNPSFEYTIGNKPMNNIVEKELTKIFNKYNMCVNLKLIFSDLFFHGMIPLEKIATKPIELVDNDEYLSINIFDKMTVNDIKHFIEDNKEFFNNFRKEEKLFLAISKRAITMFDLKHYAKKLSPGITRTYNKIYNEEITKDAVRQSNGRCKKRINSIFYPKN